MKNHSANRIKKQETLMSWAILVLLSAIAAGIFSAQFRDNPVNRSIPIPKAAQSQALTAMISVPDMLIPMTSSEEFDSASLSDKIDGKAELYLSAGFRQLRCQRFSEKGKPASWLEAFIFEMQTPSGAFSVFSTQRREGSQPLDLAPLSYRTPNAAYLSHGAYYLEVIAASPSEKLSEAMRAVLGSFVKAHPVEKAASDESALFPKAGLIEGSITLISADVFGYDALNHVFTAKYKIDNVEMTAFLSRRSTPDEAQQLAAGYYQFLMNFGGKDSEIKDAKMIEIMDNYDVVFHKGNMLAGVHESPNKDAAQKLAAMLAEEIQK
jgi:hypothetical protein